MKLLLLVKMCEYPFPRIILLVIIKYLGARIFIGVGPGSSNWREICYLHESQDVFLKIGKLFVPMSYCVERKIQILSINRGWIYLMNRWLV